VPAEHRHDAADNEQVDRTEQSAQERAPEPDDAAAYRVHVQTKASFQIVVPKNASATHT